MLDELARNAPVTDRCAAWAAIERGHLFLLHADERRFVSDLTTSHGVSAG